MNKRVKHILECILLIEINIGIVLNSWLFIMNFKNYTGLCLVYLVELICLCLIGASYFNKTELKRINKI